MTSLPGPSITITARRGLLEGHADHDVSQNIAALLRTSRRAAVHDSRPGLRAGGPEALAGLGHVAIGWRDQSASGMAREHSGCEVCGRIYSARSSRCALRRRVRQAVLFHVPGQELPRVLHELHATLKPRGVLFSSNPQRQRGGLEPRRYGAYHDLEAWRRFMTAAGFRSSRNYYRPEGLPRDRSPGSRGVRALR